MTILAHSIATMMKIREDYVTPSSREVLLLGSQSTLLNLSYGEEGQAGNAFEGGGIIDPGIVF